MAKRSKPAKKRVKAAPKKKSVVKKKLAMKKVSTKKVAAKKKAPVKKIAVKKIAAKKAVAKPARKTVKKAPVKKVAHNVLRAAKKTVVKKNVAAKKKLAPVKLLKPTVIPEQSSLPPASELSEELVEKTVHSNGNGIQEKIVNAEEEDAPLNTEDPVRTFDKHVFEKATVMGDPQAKLHLSSVSKSSIRPSGKKPLFKR